MPPTKPPKPDPDPLEFSNTVKAWMDKAADDITALLEQGGTPTLAIDAGAVNDLRQVLLVVNQSRADYRTQVPAE